MFKNVFYRVLLIVVVVGMNVSCDQFSKSLVRKNIRSWDRVNVIGNSLTLTRVENTGAFLSLGHSMPRPLKIILLRILPLVVLMISLIYLFTRNNLTIFSLIGISFIIGGGIGNLYDRLFHSSVTDFMHIDLGYFQTGIFNFADVSIMTGLFLIIIDQVQFKKQSLTKV
jgi:signal peptidase II